MTPEIICVLTTYQRRRLFSQQVSAVLGQTVPAEVVIWRNDSWDEDLPFPSYGREGNLGVWPRFLFLKEIPASFYIVLDDDTIPGKNWLANCLDAYNKEPAVYSAFGFRFLSKQYRLSNWDSRKAVGWPSPTDTLERVDWPGHSFFFDNLTLQKFCGEPRIKDYSTCGEDVHLAYCAQKLGRNCYVLPQIGEGNLGSVVGDAGNDKYALWRMPGQRKRMSECINAYRFAGWKWCLDND